MTNRLLIFTLATRDTVYPSPHPLPANVGRNFYISPSPIPLSFLSVKIGREEPTENRFRKYLRAAKQMWGIKTGLGLLTVLHGSSNTIYLFHMKFNAKTKLRD
jgi:hypothetical protein